MVATVSPSHEYYEETTSTLRYADQAKSIVNRVRVNEDDRAKIVKNLQQQVNELQDELSHSMALARYFGHLFGDDDSLIDAYVCCWCPCLN
jgi:hypothetical protein